MDEILEEFKKESQSLIADMTNVLETIEENSTDFKKLAEYGNFVDRIMGAAKTMGQIYGEDKTLQQIAAFAELCKIISYRMSRSDKAQLLAVVLAFLADATETLQSAINITGTSASSSNELSETTFLDRLKWILNKLPDDGLAVGTSVTKTSQNDVDALLKSLIA